MSAFFPYDTNPDDTGPGLSGAVAREQALRREIEALRAENNHLRRRYAASLSGGSSDKVTHLSLPLPLQSALAGAKDAASDDTAARFEYEALFGALSSVFPIGVFRTDANGLLTHVDEALQNIFDLEAQDFPNFGWLARVHPDDLERVQDHWSNGVTHAQPLSVEFRLVLGNGSQVHVLVRNAPMRDASGTVSSQLGFVQDITAQRSLEADARIKDELNRQIISSSPDCTKVLNLDGQVVQMTAQGCRLLDIDDFEEVRGQLWTQWWPEDGAEMARAALESARRGDNARFVGFTHTFKGRPTWWDNAISPILGPDGEPAMLLAVSREISDQYRQHDMVRQLNVDLENRVRQRTDALAQASKRVRDALREAQSLYDQAPCGYHSLDADGMFVLINQTELDWLGYTREEVVGKKSFRELIDPAFLEHVEERLARIAQGLPLEPAEMRMLRRDGSSFLGLISTAAVLDADGRFIRSNSTLIDITERKAAEEALHAQRNFLQTITNSVQVQLAFYDRSLICQFANASYARWLGRSPEQLIGLHLSEIANRQNYESALPMLSAALEGKHQRFEGVRAFPGGPSFYASIEYTPHWHDGQVKGLFIQMLDISERKASEDMVAKANEQLQHALTESQALYNQAPCGYHSLDIDGRCVMMNDTELQWLGYSREEVVGKMTYYEFLPPDLAVNVGERIRHLLSAGHVQAAEYELRRRDGTTFSALISSTAVLDEEGQFLRTNTTVLDISGRKAAEDALRANQRFLQAITDHVPGMIAYLDNLLHFRFANAEHLRLYGMDPVKMVGLHVSECIPAVVWEEVAPYMHAALKGEPQHFEAWRTMTNGTPAFVSASYLPDIHAGRVQGIFVQIIDITERRRIEERVSHLNEELEQRIQERSKELLESEQRFRLMVDNLREYSIYFMDPNGVISDWTDSAQRMKGYSPTEMIGKPYAALFDLPTPEGCEEAAQQALRIAASRGQHVLHAWLSRKDGSRFWAHSLLIALRDDEGELRGYAKINRDMSDAKRLEDLMRNINDELESRVTERTEQLVAANKDLEAFSYSVSHDLRSPLRHISSFVSLLEEQLGDQRDEVISRYLSTIGNSTRHMSQLIDGLLAFSRLGRAAVSLAPVDFSMLVEATVSQLAHDTEGRVVDWVIAPDMPVVQGDALLLREVWANLLGNAFKYSRPRERTLIEIGWSIDPAVGYTFYVRDNGVGFDPKYAQKLFGVFQRLHRASEFEGTGIGLALTRRILERHGGSIWAESQVGVGSVFYFSLPFDGVNPADSQSDSFFAVLGP